MRRTAVTALVVLLLALAAAVTVPVLWLAVDEAAVPAATDAPTLPDGTALSGEAVSCGSGGCWREWTLRGPQGWSAAEVAASLPVEGDGCTARSLLDRRRVCTWVRVVDGEARLFLQFDRPWE